MEDKNQLTILVQDVKNEIDRIEKDIQRHEMDIQVSNFLIEQPRCYCPWELLDKTKPLQYFQDKLPN